MMAEEKKRFREIRKLFDGAAILESPQREAWLDEMAGEDVALRQAVDRLLAASNHATGVFENPQQTAILSTPEVLPDRWEGRRLGPYEIQSEIGQGGMGIVYLARRADGAFEKQVAIKVVRQSLATQDFLTRFQREREILAKLEHPNIARLLDGGTSPSGQAYLVMEYVPGEPLLDYADSRRLPHEHRLDLLRQVAEAIDYAHEQGVVHRDLKPSNILVGAKGQVKLLDFGIAAWQHPEPRNVTEAIITPTIALSPAYASPEQARGAHTTGASDIYSFAMVAYELLSGVMPFDTRGKSLDDVLLEVAERQPMPPSRALVDSVDPSLFELAARRRTSPAALENEIERTVDQPLLRALSKRPEDRPRSAGRLIRELSGHTDRQSANTVWSRTRDLAAQNDIVLFPAFLTIGLQWSGQMTLTFAGWAVLAVATLAAIIHRQGWTRQVLPKTLLAAVFLSTGPSIDVRHSGVSVMPDAIAALSVYSIYLVTLIFTAYVLANYLRRAGTYGELKFRGRRRLERWQWVLGFFFVGIIAYWMTGRPFKADPSRLPVALGLLLAHSLLPFEIRRKGLFVSGDLIPWTSIRAYRFHGNQLQLQLAKLYPTIGSRTLKIKLPPRDLPAVQALLIKWLPEMPLEPGEWYSPNVD